MEEARDYLDYSLGEEILHAGPILLLQWIIVGLAVVVVSWRFLKTFWTRRVFPETQDIGLFLLPLFLLVFMAAAEIATVELVRSGGGIYDGPPSSSIYLLMFADSGGLLAAYFSILTLIGLWRRKTPSESLPKRDS